MTLRLLLALAAFLGTAGPAAAQEPGLPFSNTTGRSADTRLGSVLVYNLFTSSATDPESEDTRLTLTNTSATAPAFVRLFFVDGRVTLPAANVANTTLCLAANQTVSFLASEIRPGVRGFVIAVAVDGITGLCTSRNVLSGQAHVWLASGFRGSLEALGIPAIANNPMPCVVSTDGSLMALFFDGLPLAGSYNRMPRVLHLVDLPSPANQRTLLVVNRIGGNLGTSTASLGALTGSLQDDAGNTFSFSVPNPATSQLVAEVSGTFPGTAPPPPTVIPAGRTGWLKLFSPDPNDFGLTGEVLYAVPGTPPGPTNTRGPAPRAAFATGAVNLTPSTFTAAANYVLPVFPPGC